MSARLIPLLAGCLLLGACSTSYWYNQIQGRQYDKCEKLENYEERRRCKIETQPDQAKYDKQREASQSGGKQ